MCHLLVVRACVPVLKISAYEDYKSENIIKEL